jgi:GIY-YIG catalytic domain
VNATIVEQKRHLSNLLRVKLFLITIAYIKMDHINIENDVIFGRTYILYNIIDNYIYIGSTTVPLKQRMKHHILRYRTNIDLNLYNHMRKIGIDKWNIKLLEGRVVENIFELRQMEQKWIDKYNKDILLNEYSAINKNIKQRNSQKLCKDKIRKRNRELLKELRNFNLNDD